MQNFTVVGVSHFSSVSFLISVHGLQLMPLRYKQHISRQTCVNYNSCSYNSIASNYNLSM